MLAHVCPLSTFIVCFRLSFPPLLSQIFFRAGVLKKLEAKLLESLTDRIIQLQAYCRGNLARKRVEKKKVQLLAVRCIQRNVRAFSK